MTNAIDVRVLQGPARVIIEAFRLPRIADGSRLLKTVSLSRRPTSLETLASMAESEAVDTRPVYQRRDRSPIPRRASSRQQSGQDETIAYSASASSSFL